jgi:hypothetical protein
MAYDNQQTYNKYRASNCGCTGEKHEHGCGCKKDDKCGCCPTGLVAVEDNNGNNIACLSPNDAQEYMANTFRCPDGYIRVLNSDGKFVACLSPSEYAEYIAAVPAP